VKSRRRILTSNRPSRQAAARRRSHRPGGRRPRLRLGWRGWLAAFAVFLILSLLAWGSLARKFAPSGNTTLTRFDVLIVLGVPADEDGNPTPAQLSRVNEAVHEYERGIAPRMIMTGGAVHSRFVQGQVMAQAAHAQGIPESAIFVEPQAVDTIQNACYAVRIMKAHGWSSAEVISSAAHLPRAGLILSRLPLQWRTHAAPTLQPESDASRAASVAKETLKTVRYLVYARQNERCEP